MTIITTYTLKPDTDYEAFKRWSEEEDQPVCRAKPLRLKATCALIYQEFMMRFALSTLGAKMGQV